METDTLTQAEKQWLAELKRVIDKQPKNLRIMVHAISLCACRPDEVRAYFEEHGHLDNVPDLWSMQHDGKFQPNSEST